MHQLAIVIPYFKPDFFRQTLMSIKNQTDGGFYLYIGDDNSPHDPQLMIYEVFGDSNAVTYKKFEHNIGAANLTMQWQRCIDMANQPYIWLFSDDDIMPPDSVKRFYEFIKTNPQAEIMRFNLQIINDNGMVLNNGGNNPAYETADAFMLRRLRGECISAACEYIFTKEVYLRERGFVNLPAGWAADDATWINFGDKSGIFTIPGAPVSWRFGNISISSSTKNIADKTKAALMFVNFVRYRGTATKQLQLYWLYLQLNVFGYSTGMKIKFFFNLVSIKMFSIIDLINFAGTYAAKKYLTINKP